MSNTDDQQSKYFLKNNYINEINELSYKEEISRLNLFFPKVDLRIAVSFFKLENKGYFFGNKVKLLPPIIKDEIRLLKNIPQKNNIVIYISPYSKFVQSAKEVFSILSKFTDINFSIYAPINSDFIREKYIFNNIKIYVHGDKSFLNNISKTNGVISTAGHSFISEMIYLKIPMYLIPLGTYEQNFNAKIISDNKFGILSEKINSILLKKFINNIDLYRKNIKNDKKILLKGLGQKKVIKILNKFLLINSI